MKRFFGVSSCKNSFVKINDDDLICGKKTGLVYQKCTDSLSIQFLVGATAYKGIKLYYESKKV